METITKGTSFSGWSFCQLKIIARYIRSNPASNLGNLIMCCSLIIEMYARLKTCLFRPITQDSKYDTCLERLFHSTRIWNVHKLFAFLVNINIISSNAFHPHSPLVCEVSISCGTVSSIFKPLSTLLFTQS